jgi:hypothetical protein
VRLRWVELGLMLLAALFAIGFHLRLPSLLPSEDDYRRMAETVAREAAPGDAVLLHPWWIERSRLFIPESIPVVSYLDDEGDPLEEHPRIWVLAQPDLPEAPNGRFERAFSPHRLKVGETRHFGRLELSLYKNQRYRQVLYSAADALGAAHAYIEQPDGQRADCSWDGQAFRCPVGRDLRVAAEWHEMLYRPARCLWMHPPGGATRLVVELPPAPPGRLRLESGIAWEQAWKHEANLTPVVTTVENVQGGQPLARLELPPGREGFQVAEVTLPEPASLKVSTQSANESQRDSCVRLRVLGPSEAEGP